MVDGVEMSFRGNAMFQPRTKHALAESLYIVASRMPVTCQDKRVSTSNILILLNPYLDTRREKKAIAESIESKLILRRPDLKSPLE